MGGPNTFYMAHEWGTNDGIYDNTLEKEMETHSTTLV